MGKRPIASFLPDIFPLTHVTPGVPITQDEADRIRSEYSGLNRNDKVISIRPGITQWTAAHPPLIAISGKMRSGKTTLAEALSRETGAPVVSFADPLKDGCRALGIAVDEKNKDRVALQEIANFLVQRDPAHFVKMFDKRTAESRSRFGAIVPDMRLPQEWAWAKANGFLLVRLEVSPDTQEARGGQPSRLDHWTETSLDFLPQSAWDVYLTEANGIQRRDVEERVSAVLNALSARQ
jgi:hypothetical protein